MTQPPPPGTPEQPPHPEQPPPHASPYGQAPRYDQQWGYGPPGNPGGQQQGGPVSSDETTWALMAYLGTLLIGFIAPLVTYFVKRRESAFVRFHSAQALNYQITILIQILVPFLVAIVPAILTENPAWFLLALPTFLLHMIAQWVFLILGTIKASKGVYYRFPTWLCFPMIR
ncbi:DUF4870 domain-containing protein [Actinomadura craniellae]|uniref:DUF4870 domain-containing protein n=1 Tax=Actinomadura craniellae TaxID=2231787 RepID=A0A365H0C4_9ACTN|nr:DUF4870 domain-containing protein [Actinomadura craniellae]RAY12517.1 DUF4870 domain-containing protein [Actinomadura craniellae]